MQAPRTPKANAIQKEMKTGVMQQKSSPQEKKNKTSGNNPKDDPFLSILEATFFISWKGKLAEFFTEIRIGMQIGTKCISST